MKTKISIPHLFHSILRLFSAASLLAALILSGLPAQPAHAAVTILYVRAGWYFGDCTSWNMACELPFAMGKASSGTEIWVVQGVYYPSNTLDRSISFQLMNGVALYGGFVGTETAIDQRDPAAHLTFLSGQLVLGDPGLGSIHVVTAMGTNASAVLDGFTISDGYAFGSHPIDLIGGGMLNVSSSPILTNIRFSSNSATKGGGMYNLVSSPILTNVTFIYNGAQYSGGGMYNESSSPALSNVNFNNNSGGNGGGMYNNSQSSPALTNVTFNANGTFAGGNGGGMYNDGSSPILTNVTFINNSASANGGGIYNNNSSNPILTNAAFIANSAVTGGGIANLGGNPSIRNSILWGNTAPNSPQIHVVSGTPTLTYSDVQGGCPVGTTCSNTISADPLLGPVGTYGGSTQVYPLLPGSPAIDAGDNATCAASDQRGFTRPQGANCDMGAFESRGFSLAVTGGDPQSAVVTTAFDQPLAVSVSSAYGEPVNGGNISFAAPASGASAVLTGSPAAILDGETSVTATANNIVGAYTVTGDTSGAAASAVFHLGNRNACTLFSTTTGAASGTCETWGHACDLQYALSLAPAGAEIWAAAGTYKPFSENDRSATFQLKNDVELYGGFAGNETARTQRNPAAQETILSGDIGTRSSSDNTYHVVTGSGTDASAVLDGFTISGGNANGAQTNNQGGGMINITGSPKLVNITFSRNNAAYGGGLFNYNNSSPILIEVVFSDNFANFWGGGMYNSTSSSPRLTRVTFSSNSAGSYGGGMYNYNSSNPTLGRGTFSCNSASTGGGMYNNSSSPTLTIVGFKGNTAGSAGGGMYNTGSSPTLIRSTFIGNTSASGGGLYNDNSSPTLTNITFSANNASLYGGGMYNLNSSSPALSNVTFSTNSATSDGGGMYNSNNSNPALTNVTFGSNNAVSNGGGMYNSSSSPIIRNSILWGNTAESGLQIYNSSSNPTVTYSDVQSGCPDGTTCTNLISTDPLLGALGSYGGGDQVFPLLPGSPAIDTGDDATCAARDQRNIARPQGIHCDMGAFESRRFSLAITGGDDQSTLVNLAFAQPLALNVSSAYGEPVNGGNINFVAPASGASAILSSNSVTIAVDSASVNAMANDTTGSYNVTASAAGVSIPITFHLTNIGYKIYLPLTIR